MQVSGYPSNTQAAGVSKETTKKELLSIGNIPKQKFKDNNMELMYGPVNAVTYCNEMMNYPTITEVHAFLEKEGLLKEALSSDFNMVA